MAAWDRGDFFAAHEALEPAWMGTDDLEERALHQGLIKVAAAYVHAVRRNPAGIAKNLSRRPAPPRPGRRRRAAHGAWTSRTLIADIDARLADPALAATATTSSGGPHPHEPSRRHPRRRSALRRHPPPDPVRPAVILDVREADEFREVRVPGSLFVPMSELGARLARCRRTGRCSSCAPRARRSQQVTGFLLQNGWEDVGNIAGGITAWERMGLPVDSGPVRRRRGHSSPADPVARRNRDRPPRARRPSSSGGIRWRAPAADPRPERPDLLRVVVARTR